MEPCENCGGTCIGKRGCLNCLLQKAQADRNRLIKALDDCLEHVENEISSLERCAEEEEGDPDDYEAKAKAAQGHYDAACDAMSRAKGEK